MYVVAREYRYSMSEFEKLQQAMKKLIAKAPPDWTPHFLWHLAIVNKPKGDTRTYLERAMHRYDTLLAEFKAQRARTRA